MKLLLRSFLLLFLLGILAAGSLAAFSYHWYHSKAVRADVTQTLLIAPGTGFKTITQKLTDSGLIDYPLIYQAMVVIEDKQRDMKAGEYVFSYGASPAEITNLLVKGESINHSLTFLEGLTTRDMLEQIAADDRLTGDIPKGIGEGTLMPDTYQFHRGDTRASLIATMQKTQQNFLNKIWENRAPNLPYTTKEKAIIMASVIERETGVSGERAKVAGVFVNRLRIGMMLQSDPTVVYGIELAAGKKMERQLFRGDLQRDHPHNTYTRTGLPPTPIANPSRAAIQAALNPEKTDAFYFVATGRGGHYFAKTLREHNQNVVKYKRTLRALAQ